MPANHRFVLSADADWFQNEAAKIGAQTGAYVTALLKSRPYRNMPTVLVSVFLIWHASILMPDLKAPANACWRRACFLIVMSRLNSNAWRPIAPEPSLPAHENVRGDTYYH